MTPEDHYAAAEQMLHHGPMSVGDRALIHAVLSLHQPPARVEHAAGGRAESASPPDGDATQILTTVRSVFTDEYHAGPAVDCGCPKAACGYVIAGTIRADCPVHDPSATMHAGHFAARCPATPLIAEPAPDVESVWDRFGDRWWRTSAGWSCGYNAIPWSDLVTAHGPIRLTPSGGAS